MGELHGFGKHELLRSEKAAGFQEEDLRLGRGWQHPRHFRSEDLVGSKPTRWYLRAGVCGAAAILVAVAVYWVSLPEQAVAPTEMRLAADRSRPAMDEVQRRTAAQADATPTSPRTQAPADAEDTTIAQYAAEKYQILLDDLRYLEAPQLEQLRRALLKRERIAGESNTAEQKQALAKAEDQIRGMLHPAEYVTYETLKDSDLELFKLNEYAGGITNVAPLSAADREAILKTKLAYKERFRRLLLDSGLQRENSSPAEREYAYSVTSRALEDYKLGYLREVHQYLADEEQFALLSNYETTEFKTELARLRSMADVPSPGGS